MLFVFSVAINKTGTTQKCTQTNNNNKKYREFAHYKAVFFSPKFENMLLSVVTTGDNMPEK